MIRNLSILIASFFILPIILPGQSEPKKHSIFIPTFNLAAGSRILAKNYDSQLNSTATSSQPLNFIGLGIGHNHFDSWGVVDKQILFSGFLPNRTTVQDSIHCNLSGFMAGLTFSRSLRVLFRKKKQRGLFYLCMGFVLNGGKMKLYERNVINKSSFFLNPKLLLSPSLFYKHIIVSVTVEYERDFFQFNWENKGQNKFNDLKMSPLDQTALTPIIRVAYRIF